MKVSVSVVTYQQASTVRQAVESVLEQQVDFPIEIIAGDDASTDGTREALQQLQFEAPETVKTILRHSNAEDFGLTNVLATVDAAQGEYIAFLDGDDYWTDRQKLAKQVAFLDAHPDCVICAHRVQHLRKDGVRILSPNAPHGECVYDIGALIVRNFAPKISTVIRRSALADLPDWYRLTSYSSADWLLNILAGRHGRVGFIDQVMAVHRIHQASVSANFGSLHMISDKLRAITALRSCLPQAARDLTRLERKLLWKRRIVRWSPRAFSVLRRLNGMARSHPG